MHKLPNILSAFRIISVPILILLLILTKLKFSPLILWSSFGVYTLACLTDFLDGYIARKYNFVSPAGALLDEIADKLFVVSVMVTLMGIAYITGWGVLAVGIIIIREVVMPAFRQFLGHYNIKVPASFWGKLKTTVQMIALGLIILTPYSAAVARAGFILLWVAAALTVFSAADYFYKGLAEYSNITKKEHK